MQVQPLAGLLPYQGWTLRPLGGRGAKRVALDIVTSLPGATLSDFTPTPTVPASLGLGKN